MAIHPMRVMANKTPRTMFIGDFDALLVLETKNTKNRNNATIAT